MCGYTAKGFMSTYFLVLWIMIMTMMVILLDNAMNQSKTLENLEEANQYFMQEYAVIEEIKNMNVEEIEEAEIHCIIEGEYPEEIIVYFDLETGKCIDYVSYRYR